MNPAFSIARLPRIEFGVGALHKVPALVAGYGSRVLVVTGHQSFQATPHWPWLNAALTAAGCDWQHITVHGEPSPQWVDATVAAQQGSPPYHSVLGIGGGSVLDAAKAVAGLLRPGNSVLDHLEGVGPQHPYRGPATPYIAVPTTAGTGSEATKNAVLSVCGADGYKKSFRDEQLVPQYAVVDPDLLASCPPALIAANGMDALTQLLESYLSTRASPFTDALALAGLAAVREGLLSWYTEGSAAGRAHMAYAALLSGITLAQAGLGSVHGLAAPLGAYFPIPHGVVCGTLVAAATRVNLMAMQQRDPHHPGLARYAQAGRVLLGQGTLEDPAARHALVNLLYRWTEVLALPTLSQYGMTAADFTRVIKQCRGSSMKTNPIDLSDNEVGLILRERL